MEIQVEGTESVVVSVAGEVDLATAPQLEQLLSQTLDRPETREVRVDMSQVEFMDSAGLRVLVGALGKAADGQRGFALQSPSDRVHRLIEIAGLTDQFGVTGNGTGPGDRASDGQLETP